MVEPTKDFEELLAAFARHGVRSLIVGAHAVAFHAKPRYTKDLDVLLEPSPDNAGRVVAAIEEFGFSGLGIGIEDFSVPGRILQLGVAPNRIDLVTSIDAISFEEAWRGRAAGHYGAVEVFFLGRDELIRNKRAVGRPQDLADLSWLEREKP